MKNKIYCPLVKEKIDDGECFDIHMVVGHEAPKRTIRKEILEIKDYEKICLACSNHRDD
mgnify:CR=1 FL=1